MAIDVGQQAPDFTLVNEENEKVTLSELRGSPVVLMFYPFSFSPPCTAEACEVRDSYSSWMDKGAQVFGVSGDSRFVQAAFKAQEQFPYSLLADLKGDVARQYGCWNDQIGVAERATVVIDREGQVVYSIHNPITQTRDHAEVEQYIQ
ncbi:MAG: peroxiredoxin family protein [Dehalococcoidia bacterium]